MEGNENTAPGGTQGQPTELLKSSFSQMVFADHEKSDDEQRDIVMFHDRPHYCAACCNLHVEIFEFYYHFN